ncbi:dihydrodipicolinate synthase family protein [Paenibacillus sp. OV219]|uniref:dihydrodipicolinate synthase family protein n=1 Tax=Paenibacillus sp. OV219 TaxID=1884377 RepID=UPI0008CE144C|nr:dihydrodipicolinate synthase family protein [Paenibacillus sp. OV219]SEO63014.1 4-hydroxy-tetrahydrodipicolinate synthase [Paenibacillus sp. OV219]
MKHEGVYTALITPFHEDGRIDFEAMENHVDFLVRKGVNGIFPNGTTGEMPLLSIEERKQVAELVVRVVDKRVPVVVHVGDISTQRTIELAQHAEKIGANGISAICPYFYGVDDKEIIGHYHQISKAVSDDFFIFAYTIPSNGRNHITPQTMLELWNSTPNIRGLKNSSDNFSEMQRLLNLAPEGFSLMMGPDHLFLAGLHIGAAGNVSGLSNAFPEFYVRLFELFKQGNYAEAKKEQRKIEELVHVLRSGAKPSLIKRSVDYRGLVGGYVRAPLSNISQDEVTQLYKQLEKIEAM